MEKKALARYLAVILLSGLSFTAVANTTFFKARTNIKPYQRIWHQK
ncbi:hypothetical protein AB6E88_03240 [Providencia hangzhouensis]